MALSPKQFLALVLCLLFATPGCLGGQTVGSQLDDFSFIADDGDEYSRDGMKGSAYLIHFSASWCSRCYKSMHNISDVIGDMGYLIMSVEEEDLNGLSSWHGSADGANSTQDLNAPFMDGSELSETLGVNAMPTIYLISEDGNIIDIHKGDFTDHDEISRFVEQV